MGAGQYAEAQKVADNAKKFAMWDAIGALVVGRGRLVVVVAWFVLRNLAFGPFSALYV